MKKKEDKKEKDLNKEIKILNKKIKEIEIEKENYLNSWKIDRATLENYKKQEKEREIEIRKYIKEDFIESILPVLDNVNLAEKSIPEEKKQDGNIKGLLMIKMQLEETLKHQGLEIINNVGEKFDPLKNEIIAEVEGEEVPGTVVEIMESGYSFQGKILKPAKVKIIK